MDCRQPRTIVELAEILLASYRGLEARTGKPLGIDAKNAIAKNLARSDAVDMAAPVILMAKVDLRSLPAAGAAC